MRELPAASTLSLIGRSGYGKSALLRDGLRAASSAGWTVFETRCYAGQQRTPGAALRRLISDQIQTLSSSRHLYVSGLERELTSAATLSGRFEVAFLRLLEGLLVDCPCIVAIDDAQWLDKQTASTLQRLADAGAASPLALLIAHQVGFEPPLPTALDSVEIELESLATEDCHALIRSRWAAVPVPVAASIVEQSNGVPFDLVSLTNEARSNGTSSPSSIAKSARAILSDSVLDMQDDQRDFLQLCSLLREPIDTGILSGLVGDGNLLDGLIARSSGRYIAVDGSNLRFSHGLVADAIRATIPSSKQRPLRRRLLAAYAAENSVRPADLDQMAALAAELGDRETEFRALTRLAEAAYEQDANESVIVALERALSLRRPDNERDYVNYYNQYSVALRLVSRWTEARSVLEGAVSHGIAGRIRGVGLLASTLLWIIRMEADRDEAQSYFEDYHRTITDPADRHDLLAMGALLYAEAADFDGFNAIAAEIRALPEPRSRYSAAAFHIAEATIMSRLGRFRDAWTAIAAARTHVDRQRSVHKYSVDCFANGIQIKERGCAQFRIRFSWLERRPDGSIASREPPQAVMLPALELSAIVDFAAGRWASATAKLESIDLRKIGPCSARTNLLCLVAAIAAFSGQDPDLADVIEADLAYSRERELWQRSLPLAFWWAAHTCEKNKADAQALITPLQPFLGHVPDSTAFSFPIDRVLYAIRAADKQLLKTLLATRTPVYTPWDRAHEALAVGLALHSLKDPRGASELRAAQTSFEALEAYFFEAFAAKVLGRTNASQRQLLDSLGVDRQLGDGAANDARLSLARASQPTLREREVAALVAEGLTNRKVAERLSLSERTVEVHIANLFSKLNVSNRTQLVRLVMQDADRVTVGVSMTDT